MHDDADETIERIAAALRPLPDVNPAQRARVLVAVAAERERDRRGRARRVRSIRLFGAGSALAAAGLIGALWMRGSLEEPKQIASAPAPTSSPARGVVAPGTQAQLVERDADGVALQPVQLVLRAPAARRVTVVGDFNGWDASATQMTRDAASGMWSQTLALRPGRHIYAFVVDDSVWMRDPRSPAAPDADFGRPGSVLLVGRP
jgi:hypothetical protein